MGTEEPMFTIKEKRDVALTVRLPASVVKKIKSLSKNYNYSQSEVIETVIMSTWNKEKKSKDKNEKSKS